MATKTTYIIVGVLVLLTYGAVRAADVTTSGGLSYSGVTITEVTDAFIKFRLDSGSVVTKALNEIKKVHTEDCKEFDQAEELFAAGKHAEAVDAYQQAVTKMPGAAMTALCQKRLAMAKESSAAPADPAKTGGTAPTTEPAKTKCPICKGVGTVPCEDCKGTGLDKCADCKGTGSVTCPKCDGEWRKDPCWRCNGTGKVALTRDFKGNVGTWIQCRSCNGKGYSWFCPKCSGGAKPGTITCPTCNGKGHAGNCPTCNGTKKVPCKFCHPDEAKAGTASQPSGDAKVAVAAKEPDVAKNPLASPDAMMAYLVTGGPSHPQKDHAAWDKMTTMQQRAAMEKFQKELTDWQANQEFKGKSVKWTMALVDASPALSGDGFTLKVASPKGVVIMANLPASAKDDLLAWKKDDRILLSCKIDDYSLTGGGGAAADPAATLTITVVEAAASLAK